MGSAPIFTTGGTADVTRMMIALDWAVGKVAQVALLLIWQATTSPSFILLLLNCILFIPVGFPFTVHWKEGFKPPFAKVALNVVVVPKQICEDGV